MSSILDIKRKLERHREALEQQRDSDLDVKRKLERHRDELEKEEEPDLPVEERRPERRADIPRDLGMDELLRETRNKEQKHIEELKDEIANLDDLKEILNNMIKQGEEHISQLDNKLQKYGR